MQNLPVILAVFAAAAAIIVVLFWRIKPQTAPNTDALDKRIVDEAKRAEALQAKLDAQEATLRDALTAAAAAKATTEAVNTRASVAETRANQAKTDFEVLQRKYSEVDPAIATATEQKKAADEARVEVVHRHAELTTRYAALQADASSMLERATKAEKDAATAKTEADAARRRIEQADARFSEATGKFDVFHIDFSKTKSLLAEVTAQHKAAEDAKNDLDHRLTSLTTNYDLLMTEHKSVVAQAATAQNEAANTHTRNGEVLAAYEIKVQELAEVNEKLNNALAKQKADDAASNQFKVIGQTALKEMLEEAKRGVGELAASFQKTSGMELEKHADKITKTMEPLTAQLIAYDAAVESLKKGTQENYGSLREQLSELQKTERSLHDQAKALTHALSSSPKVKGNYGELILKQLVEFVGMQDKCHFEIQASRETEEGRKIPDMVVSLPGGQKVLVDSKAVMDACVEAQKTQDDIQRAILLKNHCKNVRDRVADLSSKSYFADHQDAVEAVVLFLPAENLYATAMENDPGLTEYAIGKNIILCGPNSLMLLLKVSNQLWRRAAVEKEVKDIQDCGERIYKSACDFVEKFAGVGRKIQSLEAEYNSAVGTFEGRLLPAGRRMSTFVSISGNKEIGEIEPVKDNVREFKEATKQLAAGTPKLLDLVIGDETAELEFSAGDR